MSPSKPVHVVNVGEADFEREVLQASHDGPWWSIFGRRGAALAGHRANPRKSHR